MILQYSCGRHFLVKNENIVHTNSGLIVFLQDKELPPVHLQEGDVFTDSLLGDIFIPVDLGRDIVSKSEIERIFTSSRQLSPVFYIPPCGFNRESSFDLESIPLELDSAYPPYILSRILRVMPVEIRWISDDTLSDFQESGSYMKVSYKNNDINIDPKKPRIKILEIKVLQSEWIK